MGQVSSATDLLSEKIWIFKTNLSLHWTNTVSYSLWKKLQPMQFHKDSKSCCKADVFKGKTEAKTRESECWDVSQSSSLGLNSSHFFFVFSASNFSTVKLRCQLCARGLSLDSSLLMEDDSWEVKWKIDLHFTWK